MRRKRNVWNLLKGLLVPCVAGAVLLWFAAALDGLQDGQEAEDIRQLEEALRRGCVACYAAEQSGGKSMATGNPRTSI